MGKYKKNSLSLTGAISLGTGVMIGAAIFALLGQVAELSGSLFPIAFLVGAIIAGFSAYAYIKMSNAYPSAGGIAMYLKKAYGKGITTAVAALLMAFAMVINQSLVARTFGSYTMQLFDGNQNDFWIPLLGVILLVITFLINLAGNKVIDRVSFFMAIIKVGGIAIFAIGGLWAAGFSFGEAIPSEISGDYSVGSYLGALALAILAYAGFTTITNSGEEIVEPHKNVGRAIWISLIICTIVYLLVAFAVSVNLSVPKIIEAKDYSLAEAARPAFGKYGLWFTVGIAIIATVSSVLANVFAISRMTTMLTEMKLIPHKHFGMPGNLQQHMLTYTIVIAIALTIFFDLSRIASLGAIFYLIMDIIIQWGVFKHLRKEIKANGAILLATIVLDVVVLAAFIWMKAQSDMLLIIVSAVLLTLIIAGEKWFLKMRKFKVESSNN
ncbi:amino acid permease [Marivirga tractuosa]|uniref:Amino acid/polyamine/organocation transporter, APC superfamily n=1 Tax=Marivirga tractuosa (strain ATCC 23168 / DSM 4126 / NBRC 15989 / NCIMB 1408 / VKM B-1430 / H-43) TaxID=643867 RepID=E4TUG3_MARTH|nr:APC family permease [Marivirga tractuosa]ADR22081.1 amino acid/polyamine/organocation transporter, APC superfamily [Marivirga tractuosa DSM 4126]RUA33750.1 MAG: APC family permease [Bacteroidota bacterium]BDD13459.1 amino acid permease [Marivirga tractuosa]